MAIQISFNGPNDYDITHLPEIVEDFSMMPKLHYFNLRALPERSIWGPTS